MSIDEWEYAVRKVVFHGLGSVPKIFRYFSGCSNVLFLVISITVRFLSGCPRKDTHFFFNKTVRYFNFKTSSAITQYLLLQSNRWLWVDLLAAGKHFPYFQLLFRNCNQHQKRIQRVDLSILRR